MDTLGDDYILIPQDFGMIRKNTFDPRSIPLFDQIMDHPEILRGKNRILVAVKK